MPELDRTGAVKVSLYWLSVKTSQDVPLGDTHMGVHGQVSLFISYSHTDRPWMEIFRKELQAALFEKATVWCDQDIAEGTPWQDRLALELRGADVALILATSDYLASTWCRRELRYIRQKAQENKIKNVFWVQLKPCTWERTELASFQCKASVSKALGEFEEPVAREREIIDIVREIASAVEGITKSLDPNLTFVQTVAGDQALQTGLSIESVITDRGDFSIVCRGRMGNQADVAIKVIKRSPIQEILGKLEETAHCRKCLSDPGFIQLYDSFVANSQYGAHLVLVMEYCNAEHLSEVLKDGCFTIDETVLLICRAAEALDYLHNKCEPSTDHAITGIDASCYGLMMPAHLFYDERLHRLRFSSLSITNFMWAVLGWKKFAVLVNPESARYVAPEQTSTDPATATIDKQKLDQYMLGQLAVEMLDGRLPFPSDDADNIAQSKAEFFQDPLKYFGPWKDYHKQLAQIIATMLHKNPNERWKSMEHVVTLLRAVESEGRALARYSYLQWLDNEDFFKDFYNHFFAHAEQAKAKFTHPDKQHEKLRDAMTAVLNFYDGNEPTSLAKLVPIHKEKSVTQEELEQFERSFLEVLKHRLDNATLEVKSGMAEKVQKSWQELFRAALQYLEKGWGAKSGDGLFTPPVQRHNGLQISQ